MQLSHSQRLQINTELATHSTNQHAKNMIGNHMPVSEKAGLQIVEKYAL